jgi:putative phosphoribosyl transferase
MAAAVVAMRRRAPRKLVVAVPVASLEGAQRLQPLADEFVCLAMPEPFVAVGAFYRDFHQLDDGEVTGLMAKFAGP